MAEDRLRRAKPEEMGPRAELEELKAKIWLLVEQKVTLKKELEDARAVAEALALRLTYLHPPMGYGKGE